MNYYYINAELGEGIPDYDFVIKAKDMYQADKKAMAILKRDYGNSETPYKNFSCHEVTAQTLLQRMTIN